MILLLSINSKTAFHQQDSTGPNQYNPHSPDHILQVILEAGKEQCDRTINKLEIHAPFKPFHYGWVFPGKFYTQDQVIPRQRLTGQWPQNASVCRPGEQGNLSPCDE